MDEHMQELLRIAREAKLERDRDAANEHDAIYSEEMRLARAGLFASFLLVEFVRASKALRSIGLTVLVKHETSFEEIMCEDRTARLCLPHGISTVRLEFAGSAYTKTIEWSATDANDDVDLATIAREYIKEAIAYLATCK